MQTLAYGFRGMQSTPNHLAIPPFVLRDVTDFCFSQPDDIEARLEDGLLLLRINCGPPDDKNEVFPIPLR